MRRRHPAEHRRPVGGGSPHQCWTHWAIGERYRYPNQLGRLLAISEAYPQLKADQAFLKLQDELTGTENRVAVARGDYNKAAQDYNTYIRKFPTALTAKVIGAKAKPYFEVTNAAKLNVPTVDFSKPVTTTAPAPPPAKVP